MIEKCCENCVLEEFDDSGYNYEEEYIGFAPCDNCEECSNFRAKEELVRDDTILKVLNEKVNLLCNNLEVTFENREYTIKEILDIIDDRDLDTWSLRENN